MKRESGNVGDFLAICICMLLMTILMTAYMNSVHVIEKKEDVMKVPGIKEAAYEKLKDKITVR